jgi:ferredoxin
VGQTFRSAAFEQVFNRRLAYQPAADPVEALGTHGVRQSWNFAWPGLMISRGSPFDKFSAVDRPTCGGKIESGIQSTMPSVKFLNEKKTIEVPPGANLRKEALKAGIELYPGVHQYLNCHGLRQCASCRVMIKKGKENVNRQGLVEKLRLIAGPITYFARIGHEEELRLACATRVLGDIEVETKPSINLHGERFWG